MPQLRQATPTCYPALANRLCPRRRAALGATRRSRPKRLNVRYARSLLPRHHTFSMKSSSSGKNRAQSQGKASGQSGKSIGHRSLAGANQKGGPPVKENRRASVDASAGISAIRSQRKGAEQKLQPKPYAPGLTRSMVRAHARRLFRDVWTERALSPYEWRLAEADLHHHLESQGW